MFRSSQMVASTYLLRTHKSLKLIGSRELFDILPHCLLWRQDGPRLGRTFCYESCLGPFYMVGRSDRLHKDIPHKTAKEKVAQVSQRTSHKMIAADPACRQTLQDPMQINISSTRLSSSAYSVLLQQAQAQTTKAFVHSSHSTIKTTSQGRLINPVPSKDSEFSKCLMPMKQTNKNQSFIDKEKADLTVGSKIQERCYSIIRDGFHKDLLFRLSRSANKLWTPHLEGWNCFGQLTHQTRGCHSGVPRQAAQMDCLSPENEARCRQRLEPSSALYEKERGKSWAAVLVCLCTVGGEPSFLFTLRSSKLKGRHKGDVSFAGGKRDPSDRNVVDTALREAREELGIAVGEDRVWGVLKPLRDMSGMMIAPVLANLGPLEALSFKPNPSEVEEIFTLTLAHVCNPHNKGYTHFRTGDRYGYTLPVFRNGKHRVWGLTAVALDHTLKLIVPH